MTRRGKILLVSAACVIAVAVTIVTIRVIQFTRNFDREIVNLTDEHAKLMIRNELPSGASKSAVKQFLDKKNWAYSDDGSTVQALVRDASHNGLIQTDIQIWFSFDSNDGLKSFELKDIYTGP
jgi:hypothetical protein